MYEVPGGDEVDGSPPAPVGRPDLKGQCDNFGSWVCRVCQSNSQARSCNTTIKTLAGTDARFESS
eukprot:8095503-Pyramimonas_sp.AAC.1